MINFVLLHFYSIRQNVRHTHWSTTRAPFCVDSTRFVEKSRQIIIPSSFRCNVSVMTITLFVDRTLLKIANSNWRSYDVIYGRFIIGVTSFYGCFVVLWKNLTKLIEKSRSTFTFKLSIIFYWQRYPLNVCTVITLAAYCDQIAMINLLKIFKWKHYVYVIKNVLVTKHIRQANLGYLMG